MSQENPEALQAEPQEEANEETQLVPSEDFQPSRSFLSRQTMALGFLDVALLMANASQLTALVEVPDNWDTRFYVTIFVLLLISMTLLVVTGVLLLYLGLANPRTQTSIRRTILVNNTTLCVAICITVFNIFITAFGITFVADDDQP